MSLCCFVLIAITRNLFSGFNLTINSWAASINTGALTQPSEIISSCFDTTVLFGVSFLFFCVLLYRGRSWDGFLLLGGMGLDAFLLVLLKTLVDSPRPLNSLILEDSFSFPSGHLTSTLVFLGLLTYLAWRTHKTPLKIGLAVLTPSLAVLVGYNRLYLNAHWFTDVVAAPFLALFLIATTILILHYLQDKQIWERRFSPTLSTLRLRFAALYGRAITPSNRIVRSD
ncbi:MAG: phosphatase PAP2 family protein [Candidatus Bathyarchaeota archaeon]|nr:phosphatase PAP2 family protein [Candidatus Bathyarchaeota archaeon]